MEENLEEKIETEMAPEEDITNPFPVIAEEKPKAKVRIFNYRSPFAGFRMCPYTGALISTTPSPTKEIRALRKENSLIREENLALQENFNVLSQETTSMREDFANMTAAFTKMSAAIANKAEKEDKPKKSKS